MWSLRWLFGRLFLKYFFKNKHAGTRRTARASHCTLRARLNRRRNFWAPLAPHFFEWWLSGVCVRCICIRSCILCRDVWVHNLPGALGMRLTSPLKGSSGRMGVGFSRSVKARWGFFFLSFVVGEWFSDLWCICFVLDFVYYQYWNFVV